MYIHTQQQMETAQERQGQSEKQHSKELTAFFFLMTVEAAVEAAGFARERGAALFVAAAHYDSDADLAIRITSPIQVRARRTSTTSTTNRVRRTVLVQYVLRLHSKYVQ